MPSRPPIFLFDIDGVLVIPYGYRAAVAATLDSYTIRMGLGGEIFPTGDLIAWMESRQITSEWDMVPISLAILIERLLEGLLQPRLPGQLDEACQFIADHALTRPVGLDYQTSILSLGQAIIPGEYPSETALRLALRGGPEGQLFPRLSQTALLPALLGHTRQPQHSPTTRLFQNFCLGAELFEHTYALTAEVQTPGTLSRFDQAGITPELSRELCDRRAAGEMYAAAYTLRHSLPPRTPGAGLFAGAELGFSPEAELALELTGLQELPLVGYGRILKLAQWTGAPTQTYLKPSPVQALAAALAALGVPEADALCEGLQLAHGIRPASLTGFSELDLHVFEDSPGGIKAVYAAAQILKEVGIHCQVRAWGIARHPEKVAMLQKIEAPVYPDLATALCTAFRGK